MDTDGSVTDEAEFGRLTGPYRGELQAYCYRMLGSAHDAEDLVQDTLLRAWRAYGGFEGRSSLRTWLYRIATNVCLRALESRSRRPMPSGLGAPADDPDAPVLAAAPEVPWLEPFPDAPGDADDPGAIVASRAGMRLALIAALQYLPPRQRAALILRDVLDWPGPQAADLLGVSLAALNSLLQRARTQLRQAAPAEDDLVEPTDPDRLALLDRYATAFQNADIAALTRLLTDDAVYEMPPVPTWFAGGAAVAAFAASRAPADPSALRIVRTAANAGPALATYRRGPDGVHRAHSLQVPAFDGPRIARLTSFQDPALFPLFGLPAALG
ncbi:sigma-70 family RNA polymerase sigma factor [Actinacidiphila paucisporea]|uniref:sigma-70 family RNA polymerase sigma factor n=1 Tax=Actinacidiphila paucisporea TaxID=310782 RepID=UPI000936225B|nr:sigma-70 family RNA polymerase sigma factor [Actinacidiphila paucisporea]